MADTPTPPRRRSGAFGNAVREAARTAKKPPPQPSTYVLTCPDCGAPRQRHDLTCIYCDGTTKE